MGTSPEDVKRWMEAVRRITLHARGLADSLSMGHHVSPFRGRGLEIEGVREYFPGDDARFIDWRVTARLRRAHVKEFGDERRVPVLLLVDRSGSLMDGRGKGSGALLLEIAAALAMAAERGGDPVGLLQVTHRVEHFLPPRSGRKQAFRVIRELLALEPEGRGTDLSVGLRHAGRALSARSIVFLLSDFLLPEGGLEETTAELHRLSRRHDVVPLRILDDLRGTLPDVGVVEVADPESGKRRLVNSGSAEAVNRFRREMEERGAASEGMFHRARVEPLTLRPGESLGPKLKAFFRDRRAGR